MWKREKAAQSSSQQCLVCRGSFSRGSNCSSAFLPRSGVCLEEKLQEWRRKCGKTELPDLAEPMAISLSVCNYCLSLMEKIDLLESELEKLFRTLWCLIDVEDPNFDHVEIKTNGDVGSFDESSTSKRKGRKRKLVKLSVEIKEEDQKGIFEPVVNLDFADGLNHEDGFSFTEFPDVSSPSSPEDLALFSDEDFFGYGPVKEKKPRKKREKVEADGVTSKEKKPRKPRKSKSGEDGEEVQNQVKGEKFPKPSPDFDSPEFMDKRPLLVGVNSWFRSDCRICDLPTETFQDLDIHHREAHQGINVFVCHFCLSGYDDVKDFFAHVACEELRLSDAGKFSCQVCGIDAKNPHRLDEHYKESHEGLHAFGCEECEGLGLKSFVAFVEHRRKSIPSHVASKGGECKCSDCSFTTRDEYQLGKHKGHCHKDKSPYKCPGCEKEVKLACMFENHLVMEFHVDRRCEICGIRFKTKQLAEKHHETEHPQMAYTCHECGKSFKSKSNLDSHAAYQHSKKGNLCPICGKSVGFYYLPKHIASFHGDILPYKCEFCPERFKFKGPLNVHMAKVHQYNTDKFKHPCSVCGKICCSATTLKNHRFRAHGIKEKGLKLQSCPYCDKEFPRTVALREHMMLHTGEKPHSCPHCDHRVTYFANLKSHIKQVHKRDVRRIFLSKEDRMNYIIIDAAMSDEEALKLYGQPL